MSIYYSCLKKVPLAIHGMFAVITQPKQASLPKQGRTRTGHRACQDHGLRIPSLWYLHNGSPMVGCFGLTLHPESNPSFLFILMLAPPFFLQI